MFISRLAVRLGVVPFSRLYPQSRQRVGGVVDSVCFTLFSTYAVSTRILRRLPHSPPFFVYDGFTVAAESTTVEGIVECRSLVIHVKNYFRQGQESSVEARFDGAFDGLARPHSILRVLNLVDLRIDYAEMILLTKFLGQSMITFAGGAFGKPFIQPP